ncbi:MAG: glycine cleavage system protein H [Ponticaulis sp.]|nr:glycine cleavage system protein H [Ponticaulis sp.]
MTVKYTEDHEWVKVDGDTATVGITKYAAEQLGDVVFVELPEQGRSSNKGEEMAVVESVKAASDVYAPVSGIVREANETLEGAPETVNKDPEGEGWFVTLLMSDPSELDGLMDEDAYKKFCEGL